MGATPETVFVDYHHRLDRDAIVHAARKFGDGPILVKDHVKSRKHEWLDACFMPSAADEANVMRVVTNFVERQGTDLAGGLALRRFEALQSIGLHPRSAMPISLEYRCFYLNSERLVCIPYWDDRIHTTPDLASFERLTSTFPSSFFTLDFARMTDGWWIVVEAGDGQVSAIPDAMSPGDFYAILGAAFAK